MKKQIDTNAIHIRKMNDEIIDFKIIWLFFFSLVAFSKNWISNAAVAAAAAAVQFMYASRFIKRNSTWKYFWCYFAQWRQFLCCCLRKNVFRMNLVFFFVCAFWHVIEFLFAFIFIFMWLRASMHILWITMTTTVNARWVWVCISL